MAGLKPARSAVPASPADEGRRRLLLDRRPGEARGVVLLDGRFERLAIEREGEPERARLGEVRRGRVRATARAFGGAFVDLGLERDGLMRADPAVGPVSEGAAVEVEILAEGRGDKGPALRLLRLAEGPPALLSHGPPLEARLRAWAPHAEIETGEAALDAADGAEEAALASRWLLPRGLTLSIEPTRAMTAVDVDLAETEAGKRAVLDANLNAVRETARLLRLKNLGGLVVLDLAGGAREHLPILTAARQAFAADDPGVIIAGLSRLGVLEVAKPWRERPVSEQLCDRDGRLSARSVAQRLVGVLMRQGRGDPGACWTAVCAPDVAAELEPLVRALGPRFSVRAEPGRERLNTDVIAP